MATLLSKVAILSASAWITQRRIVGIDDRFADRPQRDAGKFQMRPGERNADDGDGEQDGGEEMAERQPPAGEHQPDDIAQKAERPGADVVAAEVLRTRHRLSAEWKRRIEGHIDRRLRPWQTDDRDHNDNG